MTIMFARLLRGYQTVRHLRFEQWWFRLLYRFKPVKLKPVSALAVNPWRWQAPLVLPQSLWSEGRAVFLSSVGDLASAKIWNHPGKDKLWLYNLHYFDDLHSVNADQREAFHYYLINRWIDENPPCGGNGWEPYPLSLRLVNWIKWFSRKSHSPEGIDHKYLVSMAQQADALSQQLEYHILGNHLFANAKALTFAGCFFQGEFARDYLTAGLKLLDREIAEQFLDDGGHFERSPMYHCILLWDLLELIQLGDITMDVELQQRLIGWRTVALKALTWLKAMIHPDGDIAFFNDAALGIAIAPTSIFDYAASLSLWPAPLTAPLTTLPHSGYSRIALGAWCLLFDHAPVGPDYLPGHAHADTLSLELSLGESRVLVNSGTSLYGVGGERLRQRGTAAHNTVTVKGENSSVVWSGFRVARRAYPVLHQADLEGGNTAVIEASHDGYLRSPLAVRHRRMLHCTPGKVIIRDKLEGSAVEASAHWHIHPDIGAVQRDDCTLVLTLPDGGQVIVCFTAPVVLMASTWHPRFGVSVDNKKMMAPLHNNQLITTLTFPV